MTSYPEYAEVNGEKYKLNTDYKVALRCFEVINDADISDGERALAIIYMLYGFIPDTDLDKFLEKATLFLQCGTKAEEHQEQSQPDMDFNADEHYIMASFMSDYKIDLSQSNMHFWQYIDLIKGLTEHCVLAKVREVRNYDLSEIKDAKTRAKMVKAKEAVKLPEHRTKEEQDAIEEFENLFKKEG